MFNFDWRSIKIHLTWNSRSTPSPISKVFTEEFLLLVFHQHDLFLNDRGSETSQSWAGSKGSGLIVDQSMDVIPSMLTVTQLMRKQLCHKRSWQFTTQPLRQMWRVRPGLFCDEKVQQKPELWFSLIFCQIHVTFFSRKNNFSWDELVNYSKDILDRNSLILFCSTTNYQFYQLSLRIDFLSLGQIPDMKLKSNGIISS